MKLEAINCWHCNSEIGPLDFAASSDDTVCVVCPKCNAHGPDVAGGFEEKGEQSAIEAWNKRPLLDLARSVVRDLINIVELDPENMMKYGPQLERAKALAEGE